MSQNLGLLPIDRTSNLFITGYRTIKNQYNFDASQLQIFDRFYQKRDGRMEQLNGKGLGLAITNHIIEIHRGHIELDSIPGVGSTFRVFWDNFDRRSANRNLVNVKTGLFHLTPI